MIYDDDDYANDDDDDDDDDEFSLLSRVHTFILF